MSLCVTVVHAHVRACVCVCMRSACMHKCVCTCARMRICEDAHAPCRSPCLHIWRGWRGTLGDPLCHFSLSSFETEFHLHWNQADGQQAPAFLQSLPPPLSTGVTGVRTTPDFSYMGDGTQTHVLVLEQQAVLPPEPFLLPWASKFYSI